MSDFVRLFATDQADLNRLLKQLLEVISREEPKLFVFVGGKHSGKTTWLDLIEICSKSSVLRVPPGSNLKQSGMFSKVKVVLMDDVEWSLSLNLEPMKQNIVVMTTSDPIPDAGCLVNTTIIPLNNTLKEKPVISDHREIIRYIVENGKLSPSTPPPSTPPPSKSQTFVLIKGEDVVSLFERPDHALRRAIVLNHNLLTLCEYKHPTDPKIDPRIKYAFLRYLEEFDYSSISVPLLECQIKLFLLMQKGEPYSIKVL